MLRFLLVVILVALTIYLVTRAVQRAGGPALPKRPQRRQEPPRIIGPDDDPDFLRDLDRRRKRPEKDDNT